MIRFADVRFDCALYNGYKPCRYGNECAGCPHYQPQALPTSARTFRPEPQPEVTGPARVLIIKTGAMGDVLRTTTLLHAIKREWPKGRITWITAENALPLLIANPLIDELLPLTSENTATLAGREFDVLLNFEKDRTSLDLAGSVVAKRRLGYAPTAWGTPAVFNPESEYALLLGINDDLKFRLNTRPYPQIIAEMAALPYGRDPYILGLTAASHRRRAEIEQKIHWSGRTEVSADARALNARVRVGLNTGCGEVFRTKQWPLENWIALVRQLAGANLEVLLMGGLAEKELNSAILAAVPQVIDTDTDNSLEEFFGVVDACDILVSSDTLGMHIAIALQKYVVAMFGSTSHREIDLFDRGEKVITDFPCSPCYLKMCSLEPMCMEVMGAETVAAAVLRGVHSMHGSQPVPAR